MSQAFKLRYDEIQGKPDTEAQKNDSDKFSQKHANPIPGRNLGIKWPDGKLFFIGYSHLISAEFDP